MQILSKTIQNNLKEAIENAPLSKTEIAVKLGVNKSTITKYCSTHFPSLEMLAQLCELLDLDANEILGITPKTNR